MGNTELGKSGELFVFRKLIELGWLLKYMDEKELFGVDWVFEKNDKIIKIQVKTSKKEKKIKMGISNCNFDFLIFTDLKDCYIIPSMLMMDTGRKNQIALTKTKRGLKNRFDLIEMTKYQKYCTLTDLGVKNYQIRL